VSRAARLSAEVLLHTPPLVSVIIRSVDRPELADALASVAAQTYPAIEIVIVDAKGEHKDPPLAAGRVPIRYVSRSVPLTRSCAANVGLENASGAFLIFLDDDDLFLPHHVERLLDALAKHPDARAAHAGTRVDGAEGTMDVYDSDFDPVCLLGWNHLPTASVLFERGLLDEGVRVDETLELYEDWDFWLQVSRKTSFARSPGISAVYRPHLGTSGMIDPSYAADLAAARHLVWKKWLPVLPPEEFERLIWHFRSEAAEQEHRLNVARHAEKELRQTLDEKFSEIHGILDENFSDNLRIAAYQNHISNLNIQLGEFQKITETMKYNIDNLNNVIQEIRNSTSYRVTKPIRYAVDLFRSWTGQ